MDNTCLYWLIAVIVLTLVELATYQLVSIWLAGGALVGMIACVLGARAETQLVAAIVAAAVLLAGTRPFVKKMLDSKKTTDKCRFPDRKDSGRSNQNR